MSVLIKGMKMPDCCNNCEFHWEEDVSFEIMHQCQVKTGYINNADIYSFPYDCPLVEIPEKHGRLIDVDALVTEMTNGIRAGNLEDGYEKYQNINNMDDCVECVKYADAVIEAEGEG